MNFLTLQPLSSACLQDAVALDQRCLGGLWTQDGYQREIDSPNSDLLMLQIERQEEVNGQEGKVEAENSPIRVDNQLGNQSTAQKPGQTLIGLACAWAILDEAHITLLAIDSAYRRQGLGQLMLYALLSLARQRGMEWATLEVRASNQAAISLYEKSGFTLVGRRPGYYQNQGQGNREDALILWCKGLQQPEFADVLEQWRQGLNLRLLEQQLHLSISLNIDKKPTDFTKSALPP